MENLTDIYHNYPLHEFRDLNNPPTRDIFGFKLPNSNICNSNRRFTHKKIWISLKLFQIQMSKSNSNPTCDEIFQLLPGPINGEPPQNRRISSLTS